MQGGGPHPLRRLLLLHLHLPLLLLLLYTPTLLLLPHRKCKALEGREDGEVLGSGRAEGGAGGGGGVRGGQGIMSLNVCYMFGHTRINKLEL